MDTTNITEACISASDRYNLILTDSNSDGWSDGSYVEIFNKYGISVLKTSMTGVLDGDEVQEESIPFMLSPLIPRHSTWKSHSDNETGWELTTFDDSNWYSKTPSEISSMAFNNSLYLRQPFDIPSEEYAAVELRFLFDSAIDVYLNGVHVYSSNEGCKDEEHYCGVILPFQLELKENVLAVRLSSKNEHSTNLIFDACLHLHLGYVLSDDSRCFSVPMSYSIDNNGQKIDQPSLMWSKYSYHTITREQLQHPNARTMNFSVDGFVYPVVNGIRIWPSTSDSFAPSSFTLSSNGTILINATAQQYSRNTYATFLSLTNYNSSESNFLSLELLRSKEADVHINMQFLVCRPNTTFSLVPLEIEYYDNSELEDVYDLGIYGVECSTTIDGKIKTLPNCMLPKQDIILSSSSSSSPLLTVTANYKVLGSSDEIPISRDVVIRKNECESQDNVYLRIHRIYSDSPGFEGFRIMNGDKTIYQEDYFSSQIAYSTRTTFLCFPYDSFEVEVMGNKNSWARNSYLNIYYVIENEEDVHLLEARFCSLQGNDHIFRFHKYSILPRSTWYYQTEMVPQTWLTSINASDPSHSVNFPRESSILQFFKTSFTINDLSKVSGMILHMRINYGCVVYCNGYEIWRHGVSGPLSPSNNATHKWEHSKATISLPSTLFDSTSASQPLSYLVPGENILVIALVSNGDSGEYLTNFDAYMRLIRENAESHSWDTTVQSEGISGAAGNIQDGYVDSFIYHHSCSSNSLTMEFTEGRREYISSIQIQNFYERKERGVSHFTLQGGNENNWETLVIVSGLTWSMAGQKRRIYFPNSKAFEKYRFLNLRTNNPSDCDWLVQSLQLFSDDLTHSIPPLLYPEETIIYKDIEIAEIIPIHGHFGYFNFRIDPPLPNVLTIDPTTGWISGTAIHDCSQTTYTVYASTITGGTVNTTLTITCDVCSQTRGLITVRFRTDSYPNDNSWILSNSSTKEVIRQLDQLPEANSYYYIDFCLEYGIYTFTATNTNQRGWAPNSGYTITVDYGEMEIESVQMPASENAANQVSSVFSSFIPFQVSHTIWEVLIGEFDKIVSSWTTGFYCGNWKGRSATNIPHFQGTAYIRYAMQIPLNSPSVLNVRVKYLGGVIAYFDGVEVARLNLAKVTENGEEKNKVIDVLTDPVFSKFHVILRDAQGKVKYIAFEVYQPSCVTDGESIVFDATGVFGVQSYLNGDDAEKCYTVVDSYSFHSSPLLSGSLESIMDLDPFTLGVLPNSVGSFLEWTVDNLVGSEWNQFNLYVPATLNDIGIQLLAWNNRNSDESERLQLFASNNLTIESRTLPRIPVNIDAAFQRYRLVITSPPSHSIAINSLFMKHCPQMSDPIELLPCDQGYRVKSADSLIVGGHNCEEKPIEGFGFEKTEYSCTVNTDCEIIAPTLIDNVPITSVFHIHNFTIIPSLPDGLSIDSLSGTIKGKPSDAHNTTVYTVYAENAAGIAFASFTLKIDREKGARDIIEYDRNIFEVRKGEEFTTQPRCVDSKERGLGCSYNITDESTLPDGLTLDRSTGTISGTPKKTMQSVVSISVKYKFGEKDIMVAFSVVEAGWFERNRTFLVVTAVMLLIALIVVCSFYFVKKSNLRKGKIYFTFPSFWDLLSSLRGIPSLSINQDNNPRV